MLIKTNEGEVIRADKKPEWNELHKRFYVWGFRFIKAKQQYSKTKTLWNFKGYSEDLTAFPWKA